MKTGKILQIAAIVSAAVMFGAVAGFIVFLARDLPQIRMLESYSPSAVSRVYSADEVLLAELYVQKRDPVLINDVPKTFTTALITTEDRQFYSHSGLDLKGIARAVVNNIRYRGYVEGASTLTQQLAKTLFLTPEKSLERKLKEAILAFQLERRYTKSEILELYVNQVYFGSGAYGVQMASNKYFGKPVASLDIAQAAMLAAMPRAPSVYSPLVNPDLAVRRRNIVLIQMRDTGNITEQEYETAVNTPYTPPAAQRQNAKKAPYFVDYVTRQAEKKIGSELLYKGGVTIRTTLDYSTQQAAESALENGLARIENRMEARGDTRAGPQGALVALDVKDGKILAMSGGRDYGKSQFNRAVDARRQPGSAFKPIVYAYAIENGFSQASLLLDAPVSYNGWQPRNFSPGYDGEITLRKALADSKNIAAVRLLNMIGPSAVVDFAGTCGINSAMAPYPSLALGSFEVSLLELTSAYSIFPNRGIHVKPYGISSISGAGGRLFYTNTAGQSYVMSRSGAAVMVDMLKGAVNEGTGQPAKTIGRVVAGKTGTTSGYRDALFIGFTPDMAAGVWTGRDNYIPLGPYETGSRAALPIWNRFMTLAMQDQPLTFFDFPGDMAEVRIDPSSGKRIRKNTENSEREGKGVTALFRQNETPE